MRTFTREEVTKIEAGRVAFPVAVLCVRAVGANTQDTPVEAIKSGTPIPELEDGGDLAAERYDSGIIGKASCGQIFDPEVTG